MAQPQMPDTAGILETLSDSEVVLRAMSDYASVDGYQSRLLTRLRRLHHYYAPQDGDQWPEDLVQRPGKIHITINKLRPLVDIDARLQAILPRIVCKPNGISDEDRASAEQIEKIITRFLELSGWDVWLADFTKIKAMYGFGVLKVFWNVREDRPDARPIENPGNLRIGWGASDFSVIDWTIYESKLSPIEVMRRFPDIQVTPGKAGADPIVERRGADHADPLNQIAMPAGRPQFFERAMPYNPSDYENQQIQMWDYWFKDSEGKVWNAVIVGLTTLASLNEHPELRDIPYIVVENDHEPGVPWGLATHEHLIDYQIERNRALAHAAQLVADEVDPAWQLTGDNADSIPDGLVPRGGEIVAAGATNEIKPIPKAVNLPAVQELINIMDQDYHDVSGMPSILFGQSLGSRVSGRALSVQTEAAANRLDFKRRRLYQGLYELINFWCFMLEKRNPKVGGVGMGRLVGGFHRWQVIAPEITPKDVIENTTNVINKIQAKLISLETGRDELGYAAPQDEGNLVIQERSNVDLFPGDVQVKTAVLQAVQALQQAQVQAQQAQDAASAAQGNASNQAQQAQPNLGQSNNDGSVQPATMPGSPAPAGGPVPGTGTTQTTLVRPNLATGQAAALEQLSSQRRF